MILNTEQTNLILNENKLYDCCLLTQQFAFKFFKQSTSPLGNVVAFTAPLKMENVRMEQALVFAAELQNVSPFALACFQRLFTVQLGTILTNFTGKDYFMDENSLFLEDKQINLTLLNTVKTSGIFHLIFPIVMTYKDYLKIFDLIDLGEKATEFVTEGISCFNYLLNNIFISTCRDNL
jgi:hypothetical protein